MWIRWGNRSIVMWIARLASLASLGLLLAFIVGGFGEGKMPTTTEWIGLLCFPAGVMLGMVWAWRSPLAGGVFSIASLIAFYIWHYAARSELPGGPYFMLFTAPALLFVMASLLPKEKSQ